MERDEELRDEETERAAGSREAQARRAAQDDEGYTNFDSLVRDDSTDDGSAGISPDRTPRASERVVAREVEVDADRRGEHHADHESSTVGDQIGEAAGGIGGVIAGAAIGSIGGPIGTVIGGIAGAIGGWWTGRAIAEAASGFSHADDEEFRADYETRDEPGPSTPDRSYERVRPAYQLGYLARRNPEYEGRAFDDIEPHLERGWTANAATQGSDWSDMRDYARTAYVRSAGSPSSLTGDSGANDSRGSAGTVGSIGPGGGAPHGEPSGRTGTHSIREMGGSMNQSSANDDAAERLASAKGSSFTRQGDVPLNTSATDKAGVSRSQDPEKPATRESSDPHGSEPDRGPSFTDPVAGEGVENIGSSGGAPRGANGTLNDTASRDDSDKPHEY